MAKTKKALATQTRRPPNGKGRTRSAGAVQRRSQVESVLSVVTESVEIEGFGPGLPPPPLAEIESPCSNQSVRIPHPAYGIVDVGSTTTLDSVKYSVQDQTAHILVVDHAISNFNGNVWRFDLTDFELPTVGDTYLLTIFARDSTGQQTVQVVGFTRVG